MHLSVDYLRCSGVSHCPRHLSWYELEPKGFYHNMVAYISLKTASCVNEDETLLVCGLRWLRCDVGTGQMMCRHATLSMYGSGV